MQLGRTETRGRALGTATFAASIAFVIASPVRADDRVDTTITYFNERRPEGKSLTVVHPQFDLGVDLGGVVTLGAGYEADVVSGATPSIYAAQRPGSVDVVTSASEFSDTRHSGHGSLTFTGSRATLSLSYTYGTERDYKSNAITVGGTVDMPGKNTILALSYTRNIDEVCDFNNGDAEPLERRPLTGQIPCFVDGNNMSISKPVRIDTLQATLTQNVTPTLVLQLGLFGQVTQGFQSNPYRRVRVFQVDAQETVPEIRDRGSAFLKFRLALPAIRSAASLNVRGYADTWGITSGDVEADYYQYLGKHVLFRLRGRFYQQSSASFFKTATQYELTGPAGQYFTGDREHAALRDFLVGGKLSYIVSADESGSVLGVFDDVDIHILAEGIWYDSLVEGAPGSFGGGAAPDAIVTELGILLRY
jgi:Protein of unknown function (DUF3570)